MRRVAAFAMVLSLAANTVQTQRLSAQEARAIARDAYIYGFPVVDSYRILYSYFVDRTDPEYKAGWTPNGPFLIAMRLYWPKQEALDGRWKQPPLQRIR